MEKYAEIKTNGEAKIYGYAEFNRKLKIFKNAKVNPPEKFEWDKSLDEKLFNMNNKLFKRYRRYRIDLVEILCYLGITIGILSLVSLFI